MKFKKTTLKNGLRIITCEMPYVQSVATTIFVGAGSRYEKKELNGISHFLEHMTFKGTKKHPTTYDITSKIEGMGGKLGAWTGVERTVYWNLVPKNYFNRAIEILTDTVFNSKFAPEDIDKERGVVIEEINSSEDIPEAKVWELIFQTAWPNQPLGQTLAGSKKNIKNITRKDFLEYIDSLYKPKNMVISTVGNIKHKKVVEEVKKILGKIRGKLTYTWERAQEKQIKPKISLSYKKTNQAHLCLGLKSLPYSNPDRFVLDLLNTILGRGLSSRLFLNIREKQALAYSIYSYNNNFQDTGLLVIYGGLNTKKITQAICSILEELNKLKNKLVTAKELKKSKEFIKGSLKLKMESTTDMSEFLGEQELLSSKTLTPEEMINEIKKVTPEDIKRVANNIFQNEKLNLAIIGPFKNQGKFEKILKL